MSLFRVLALPVLLAIIPQPALADPSTTPLVCNGVLEKWSDGARSQTPLMLDVFVNLERSTIEINDFWGCLADIGNITKRERRMCSGEQPVKITEESIKFEGMSEDERYRGMASIVINRFSATLTISSTAMAKPPANANWVLISYNAKLLCTKPARQF